SGGRGIVERRGRDRALRDRHERGVGVRNVGAEDVVEPRGVDRRLYAAVGQLRRTHERAHRERREAALEVVDRLALVGRDAGDVHEPGALLPAAGDRDHGAAVRMADEDDGAVDLVDDRRGVGSVVGEPAQRVRRRENGVTVTDEPVVHRPPAGRVSERAVNENDGRTRHNEFLSFGGQLAARCWIHQATFSRWLRPRPSTTLACTGATSSLAWSEPNGAPTTVRTARLPLA